MSLTIRLYANMFASDLVTLVFFSLIPFAIPIVFLGCTSGFADSGVCVHAAAMIYLGEAVRMSTEEQFSVISCQFSECLLASQRWLS